MSRTARELGGNAAPRVWLPAVRVGAGADVFTARLAKALQNLGIQATVTWFKHGYELAPGLLSRVTPPAGTNIVHANSGSGFSFKRSGIPLVVTVHHCVFEPGYRQYKSTLTRIYHDTLVRHYESRSLVSADKLTAVSRYTAEATAKSFQVPEPEIIPNWIDTSRYKPDSRTQTTGSPFRVLFVGNWTKRKGFDLLPAIVAGLGKGFELHLTRGMRHHTHAGNIQGNVVRHGFFAHAEDLIMLYQFADVLLFPSRLEGFGLAALEAQSCGLPVVTTTASALPEVVENGVTGILCPPNSVDSFVHAIKTLRDNPDLVMRMRAEARKRVIRKFSETAIVPKYVKLYQHLLMSRDS